VSDLVRSTLAGTVATITLNSPADRNALSAGLRRELLAAIDRAVAAPQVRAVVLTHAGPVFCSGMDLREARDPAAAEQGVRDLIRILTRIWTSPTPIVARLAGAARAGGIGIAAACDLAVAADTATFAFSEVRLGVIPALISAPVLHTVSVRAAHELFLTGEVFDAARAVQIGLLNRAVPPAELDAEVARLVAALLRGAPGALAGIKTLTRAGAGALPARELERLGALSATWFAGAEAREGLAAFRERRDPAWVEPGPEAGT
jgi:methylglutaconyl-CoA hydratase